MTDPGWDGPTDRRRAFSVEVAGVGGPRNRSGRAAVLAVVVVVALVAGGIVSSQLFPAAQAGVAPASPAVALNTPSPTAGPSAAPTALPLPTGPLTARITSDPVDVVALVASIPKHGTGPLAFVAGRLHSRTRPCDVGAPLSACLTLHVDGVRGATVIPDDAMGSWPGDPTPDETLVLLPRDGKLVYLGSLVVDPAGIPRVDALASRLATTLNHAQVSLREVDGILVRGVNPCIPHDPCPPGAPTLLAIPPSGGWALDVTGAEPVVVASGAFGIRPTATWTTGPFLVRIGAGVAAEPSWEIVALEDQASILHVVIP